MKRYRQVKLELHIVKCSDPFLWYSGKLGKRVPFLGQPTISSGEQPFFWSRDNEGRKNIVFVSDAVLLPVGADEKGYLDGRNF